MAAVVATAVDEERGRPGGAAVVGTRDVPLDAERVAPLVQLADEPVDVETECRRVLRQVGLLERLLVGEEHVVHLPEPSLGAGRLGGEAGIVVHLVEREVAEHEREVSTESRDEVAEE